MRNEFALRFYGWALRDARREFEQGFPFLNRIRSNVAVAFVDFVKKLPQDDWAIFRDALIKRTHHGALVLMGEKMMPTEEELLERFRAAMLASTMDVEDLRGKMPTDERRAANKKLKKLLTEKLGTVLGESRENWGGGVWRYRSTQCGWLFDTYVDLGGRFQLRYDHVLSARDHVPLQSNISILTWMGIGQTSWAGMQESDIADAADCLAALCSHFVAALPQLLSGLSPKL